MKAKWKPEAIENLSNTFGLELEKILIKELKRNNKKEKINKILNEISLKSKYR
jgi:hypothetical protein